MSLVLVDVTDTAAAMGFRCTVRVDSAIAPADVAQVLEAARAAAADISAPVRRVPFRIVSVEAGVIEAVPLELVLGVDPLGRPAAAILA
ncbi:hypothetical protein [Nocardia africana]|uniref:Uncharacterized protein n=1 Tax=Nocardia africana TaxID=134964 RepID=A0A379X609_9NOCA|nr:hypothetical protein [Nocardia africana]MCC3318467.1 hypothetical protein [Nocardia africana]SUH71973.1 Uncharacterised protein [Nocardia africana]